jgi:hypothetical protein
MLKEKEKKGWGGGKATCVSCRTRYNSTEKPVKVLKANHTNYLKKGGGHAPKTDLMQYHGFVGKFNQWLWYAEGQRPQPCSETSDENKCFHVDSLNPYILYCKSS